VLRIIRVLAPNAGPYTLEGTNTWVVGEHPAVVIDPGPPIAAHLDEVARVAGHVAAVLVTHDHPDHAPAAQDFAQQVGAPLHAFRLEGAQHLRDGQELRLGEVDLTAIHTPGHTSDHVAFHLPAESALFTGDAVLGRGTSFIDPPDGDLVQYLRSLKRMQELAPATLYPGHGPVVLRGPAKLQAYLDHRAQREDEILATLSDEPRRIEAIVSIVYVDYPASVHELAARSVLAHLLKLESEGRVEHRGNGPESEWLAAVPRSCERCGKPVKGRARYCSSCSLILLQEASATDPEPPAG
jgi:glyoxylase-like metal-dependent hydrolase (beta-lactamase superfamily II)